MWGNKEYNWKKHYLADINECSKNPCKNGAKCVNLKGSYRCDCKSGYTGKNCESGQRKQNYVTTYVACGPVIV